MIQIKKTILTLVALLAVTTGAWADDFLYLVVDGTSATMMYGADKGDNPYYTIVDGDRNWYVPSAYDPETYRDKETLTTVTIDASCKNYTGTTLESLFDWWSKLTTINNLENLNTSAVTDMHRMFAACKALTSLDLSCLNTASVTNMLEMFNSLTLETIDLSGWNTSNVTNMYCMFYYSQNLKTIYVGDGWSTASVTNGKLMFSGCSKLPGYDSGKVTYEMAKLVPDGYLTYKAPASASAVTVDWNKASKTGTFGMPGGNVELEPEYYPQATAAEGAVTAATGVAATTDAPLVTIDETKLTGAAKMMYYVSTEATAPAYDAEGWTDVLPTAEKYTEAANLNVWYYPVGTDEGVGGATATYSDGDMNATALAVTIAAAPTYAVTFAEGTNPEAPAEPIWTASPNTGLTKGQTVTVTYTGSKKVLGVKAEKKPEAPHLVIEDKNNFFGIGNQKFYFTEGETWTEAMANHPENAAAGWVIYNDRLRFKPDVYGYAIFILRSGDYYIIEDTILNQPIDTSKTYSFSGTTPT